MNKTELVGKVAESADVSKATAARCVDTVFDAICAALVRGDSVTMVGFGTFSVKDRAARSGRNPRTGATIHIAASKLPGFKAGKALKDAVN
jgi:DNA-binding protein HU-beta